ncbi:hypothetical protein AUC71_00980 [Methyloceanibacter marginalis]|uniref:Uncharacterized protein n=1 Tax=Methyloceanibacter marginalis TaxID=1774971 RepID=A0A1E3WCG2_9HYPH|nr:hypothetical protein [Methyloceanibacter marginalis]ODS03420.1 hypothetical protein AUC71_00980 [Methyloceanibacter marginalis]
MRRRLLRPGLTKSLGAAAAVLALAAGGSALHGAVRIEPCASTEYTASIGGAPPEAPGPDRLTLVLVGDTGFNPKGAEVAPEGFVKDGKALGFKESLSGVARESTAILLSSISRRWSPTATISPPTARGRHRPITSRAILLG